MNELMYSFRESKVRVVMQDNEPWFVAKDVCDVLEIKNTTHALTRLDDDERSSLKLGRQGETNIVNEFGLYSLILGSRKEEAKEFKRWITHEVLPSIRKNGSYSNGLPGNYKEALLQLVEQVEKKEQLERQIALDAPKVVLAESIENSNSLILIRDLAKIIKQNGYDIGEKRLFKWLRENGFLTKNSFGYTTPTQKAMNLGVFRVVETTNVTNKGVRLQVTVKVTGKGQLFFTNKFLKELS